MFSKLSLSTVVSVALLSSLLACTPPAPPRQGDEALIEHFVPQVEQGALNRRVVQGETVVLLEPRAEPRHLAVETSHRLAVATWNHVAREAEVVVDPEATLAFSVAALKSARGPAASQPVRATARVQLIDTTTGDVLVDESIEVDDRWRRHRVPVPAVEAGRLVIESQGVAPVAWSELHLLGPGSASSAPPNQVLVVIDTLRSDHLSHYGYERQTSPRLDKLAEGAHVFERSFSSSTWTLPSTGSLLTGLLPAQHGLRTVHDALADDVTTVAERLGELGYRTVAVTDGGFLDPKWGFDQGFERYDVTTGKAWQPKDVAVIVELAQAWLDENDYEPYFLFVHTYETHVPYQNRDGHAAEFFDGPPPKAANIAGPDEILKQYHSLPVDPPTETVAGNLGLYDGEIRRADHYVGELLERLLASPDGDRTALLITSDHGEEFLDHGNVEHGLGKVFDANVRVPMLLKLPGQTVGTRNPTPVSGIDIVPTLLDLAGAEPSDEHQGRSLRAWLDEADTHRPVVVEGLNSFPVVQENRYRVDEGDITLIHDLVRQRSMFFDRSTDPGLLRPLLDLSDPRADAARARLQATLAWTTRGTLAARLAAGADHLVAGSSSRIVPLGAWAGFVWRPAIEADGRVEVDLDPARESYVVFDLRQGRGWELDLVGPSGAVEQVTLSTRGADSNPLVWGSSRREPPPVGVVFPTWTMVDPATAEMTPEATRELKALGYLGD